VDARCTNNEKRSPDPGLWKPAPISRRYSLTNTVDKRMSQQRTPPLQGARTETTTVPNAAALGVAALSSQRYTFQCLVGRGAYGEVYRARDTLSGRDVAIKHIRNVFEHPPEAIRVLRELKLLRLLRGHPNIVQILDVLMPRDTLRFDDVFIILEYLPATLRRANAILYTNSQLTTAYRNRLVKKLLYDLLCGLQYMHAAGIYHRDLKPDNLLVTNMPNTVRLCICDFGLARAAKLREPENLVLWTGYVETRWYRAPELLLCNYTHYSTAIDIWSAGCIFAEMLSGGRPLFIGKDGLDQLDLITRLLGKPDAHSVREFRSPQVREYLRRMPERPPVDLGSLFPAAEPHAVDLLRQMLCVNPRLRLTAAEALSHPYFDDVDGGRAPSYTVAVWDAGDFGFENTRLDAERLRDLFRAEIRMHYHPGPSPQRTAPLPTAETNTNAKCMESVSADQTTGDTTAYEWPSELDTALEQVQAKRIGFELRPFRSLPKEKILQTASRIVQENKMEDEMCACVRTMSQRGLSRLGCEAAAGASRQAPTL